MAVEQSTACDIADEGVVNYMNYPVIGNVADN